MIKKIIIFVMFFVLLIIPIAYTKSSENFIDYLTDLVYGDCKQAGGKLGVTYEGKPVTRDFIKQVIVSFDNKLPTTLYLGSIDNYPIILQCDSTNGSYILRVNLDEYYWRDRKIGNSATYNYINQRIENVVAEKINQIAVQGQGNAVNTGDITYLKIGELSLGISIGVSLINFGIYFLIKRFKKKKQN